MADNKPVRDGTNATFQGAADELSDSSFSPKISLLDGSGSPTPISPAKATQLPAALSAGGALKVQVLEPATLATKEIRASTATQSSVNGLATSVTILAANTNRLGATVFNDSTAKLYLLLGTGVASPTVHSVQMVPGAYYEVPFGFVGALTGIWAAVNGAARVTEITQ